MGSKKTTTDSNQTATANTNANTSDQSNTFNYGGQSQQFGTQTGASDAALQHINPALGALSGSYDQANGLLSQYAPQLGQGFSNIVGQFGQTDPNIGRSNDYASSVLSGGYLNGNGYLQQALDSAARDARDMTNASVGARGAAGGSQQANLLSRNISNARNNILFQNYQNERQQQTAAAQLAAQNSQAESNRNSSSLAQLISALGLPQALAGQYASGVQNLVGNWTTNGGQSSGQNYNVGATDSTGTSASNTTGTQTGHQVQTESGGLLGSIIAGLAQMGSAAIGRH